MEFRFLEELGVVNREKQIRPLERKDLLTLIAENGGSAEYLCLRGIEMKRIDMRGLNLRKIDLSGCNLEGALAMPMVTTNTGDLAPQDLAYEHNIELWVKNQLPGFVKSVTPTDLSEAFLPDARLSNSDFRWADFRDTFMVRAVLQRVDLSHSNMLKANLKWSKWEDSSLQFANLQEACLEGARFIDTDLEHAKLVDADLASVSISTGSKLEGVDWGQNNISVLERRGDFEKAIALYRRLKEWHERAGMSKMAGEFHYREREASRKLQWQLLGQDFQAYKRRFASAWQSFTGKPRG